jgi:hypothetical protein
MVDGSVVYVCVPAQGDFDVKGEVMFSRPRLVQIAVFLIVLLTLIAIFYSIYGSAPSSAAWAGLALGGLLLLLGLAAILLALFPRGSGRGGGPGSSGPMTPRNDRLLLFGVVVVVVALLMVLQDLFFSH